MIPRECKKTLDDTEIRQYFVLARQAAMRAYNPYSRFSVGCALLDTENRVHLGCNIESASYSATLCAERVAAAQAIALGCRDWHSIFVVSPTRVSPCGVCRQFLMEFCPELKVYMGDLESEDFLGPISLADLLPMAMKLQQSPLGSKE